MKIIINKEDKNLILFFILTFIWSWLFWILEITLNKRFYLGPFGPTISAILLTFLTSGKKGFIDLLKRGVSFNFKLIWLIPIFLLMPFMVGLSFLVGFLVKDLTFSIPALKQPLIILPAFLIV